MTINIKQLREIVDLYMVPILGMEYQQCLESTGKLGYELSNCPPDTLETIRGEFDNGEPSYKVGRDGLGGSIWYFEEDNAKFRMVHDWHHCLLCESTDVEGELKIAPWVAIRWAKLAAELARERGDDENYISKVVYNTIYCEVGGQALHFQATGEFVKDQVAFTLEYLNERI